MKYPKLRNGPSPVGESLVRALKKNGAPWLSAVTADGVVANKMGRSNSEVFQGGEDGIYCLGYENADDPTNYTIRGTRSFQRTFQSRGEWRGPPIDETQGSGYIGNRVFDVSIIPTGWGKGFNVETYSGSLSGIGMREAGYAAKIHLTRYGKSLKQTYSFPGTAVEYQTFFFTGTIGRSAASGYQPAMVIINRMAENDGARRDSYGVFQYSFDKFDTIHTVGFGFGEGWCHGAPHLVAYCASWLLIALPAYVYKKPAVQYPGVSYYNDNADPNLSVLLRFTPDGDFQQIGAGQLFGFARPDPFPIEEWGNSGLYEFHENGRTQYGVSSLQGRVLANGRVIVLSRAELYDWEFATNERLFPVEDPELQKRIAVFTGSDSDGFSRGSDIEMPFPCLPGGGVNVGPYVVFSIVRRVSDNPVGNTAILIFREDGAVHAIKDLPFDAHRVSPALFAINDSTLCVPAYGEVDGKSAYRIYKSEDLGDNWYPMTTISSTAPPPPETYQDQYENQYYYNSMQNYSVVSWLRKNDIPAPLEPGAPWLADERISKPWEQS